MEAVLTCMVDEHLGPGDTAVRLIQTVKEMIGCDKGTGSLEWDIRVITSNRNTGKINIPCPEIRISGKNHIGGVFVIVVKHGKFPVGIMIGD